MDMVEITDVEKRLRLGWDIDRSGRYRCNCGTAVYGTDIITHLRNGHGIDSVEIAESVIDAESV